MDANSKLPAVVGAAGPYDRKVIARAKRALAKRLPVNVGPRDKQGLRDVVAYVGGSLEYLGALSDKVGESLRAHVIAHGVRELARQAEVN